MSVCGVTYQCAGCGKEWKTRKGWADHSRKGCLRICDRCAHDRDSHGANGKCKIAGCSCEAFITAEMRRKARLRLGL